MRQLRVRVPSAFADAAIGLLWGAGVDGIEELDGAPGEVEFGVGVDGITDRDLDLLVGEIEALPDGRADLVDLTGESEGWRAAWRAHARATVISEALVVRPPWVETPSPSLIDVVIDPGDAWGHGGHVTTRLAVELLLAGPTPPGPRVLDVGCGSGVLAIAAARLGAVSVVGVDVDPSALVATAGNAAINGVRVHLLSSIDSVVVGEADLVIANIEASVLVALASGLVAAMAPGGRLILSGFLEERAGEVSEAMSAAASRGPHTPLTEVERRVEDVWAAVELMRDSPVLSR